MRTTNCGVLYTAIEYSSHEVCLANYNYLRSDDHNYGLHSLNKPFPYQQMSKLPLEITMYNHKA